MPRQSSSAIAEGPLPKHLQLRERIIALSVPGKAIPSERELMATFGVSRGTVRRAIDKLVADGMLERTQGLGTFAVRPRVETALHLASFSKDMRCRGLTPSSRLLSVSLRSPPASVALSLDMSPGERTWRVLRIRLADGAPMAHEESWYSEVTVPKLNTHDLAGGSLYQILGEEYGLWIDQARQVLWGESVDAELSALLEAPLHTPLLVFRRTACVSGRPVEVSTSRYRGDRYQLHMELRSGLNPAD